MGVKVREIRGVLNKTKFCVVKGITRILYGPYQGGTPENVSDKGYKVCKKRTL